MAGCGYDRYGPIGELNFIRAPFEPVVGSSPRPWLIKTAYAPHSEQIARDRAEQIIGDGAGRWPGLELERSPRASQEKYRQTLDLARETGGARTSIESV